MPSKSARSLRGRRLEHSKCVVVVVDVEAGSISIKTMEINDINKIGSRDCRKTGSNRELDGHPSRMKIS